MNLREGRIGKRETVNIIGITMLVNGMFSINSSRVYANGNSTFISIPLAVALSAAAFLLIYYAIRRSETVNLHRMLEYSFGKTIGKILNIIICFALIASVYGPLVNFLAFMRIMTNDASSTAVASFILPVMVALSWMGLETIGRTANCISLLFLLSIAVVIATAADGYEIHRLYPLIINDASNMATLTSSSMFKFFPPLLLLLSLTGGTQGLGNAKRSGLIASAIAFVLVAIIQLSIGLTYNYSELQRMSMPFSQINMLTEMLGIRFERFAAMIWLIGTILTCSFYIYGASFLYAKSFNQRDIRPLTICIGTIAILVCTASDNISKAFEWAPVLISLIPDIGFAILFIPLAAASIVAIVKSVRSDKKKLNETA